jgi:hypothetical protein
VRLGGVWLRRRKATQVSKPAEAERDSFIGTAMTDAQRQLEQALMAQQFDLETQRDDAPGCDLDDQIEAIRGVLKWLDEQALELTPRPARAN